MNRQLLTILFVSFLLKLTVAAQTPTPASYIVLERYSNRVLLASGSEYKRPIADIAHMVTAKVTQDWLKVANASSATMITVPNHSFYAASENPLSLQPGDQISVRDALYAIILANDNVAARTLAVHVGTNLLQRRSQLGDPLAVFVQEMNNLSASLNMRATKFIKPGGNDTDAASNLSTASDIARLSVKLSQDPGYGFYAKQKQRKLKVLKRDGSAIELVVENSNKMLSSTLKVAGLKAGYAPYAGQCLSITADKTPYIQKLADGGEKVTPVQLIVVVLGSSDAESFTKAVVPQGWSQYEAWRNGGYLSSPDRHEFLRLTNN